MADKLANLTSYPKGVSGNLNGRPKGTLNMKTILRKMLETDLTLQEKAPDGQYKSTTRSGAEWVNKALMKKAIKGDVSAIKEVLERIDGKVPQKTIYNGDEEGGAVRMEIDIKPNKEQLDALVRIGGNE
mgnify:CR=1 FL=1